MKFDFYKVPFFEALDLVKQRKCFLKERFAYVSINDMISVARNKHEQCIRKGMDIITNVLPNIEEEMDEILFDFINNLRHQRPSITN